MCFKPLYTKRRKKSIKKSKIKFVKFLFLCTIFDFFLVIVYI